MNGFLYGVGENIAGFYRGKNLVWQGIMLASTALLVLSGFDWEYYLATRNSIIQVIGFSAAGVGFLVPVIVPLWMHARAKIKKNAHLKYAANAMIQAGTLGLLVSSSYKVFTGRVGLPHGVDVLVDTSELFRFGFYRGGAFNGWPSSHTSVAFAMSMALVALYPNNKMVKGIAIFYAAYIGLGISTTIHWFSDFIAGAILGTIIGFTVGARFRQKYLAEKK
jgi:membrane-associated phospholipid phosphatase